MKVNMSTGKGIKFKPLCSFCKCMQMINTAAVNSDDILKTEICMLD